MTKSELTSALLDRLRDPWDSVCDEDIATLDFISIDQATEYLAELRKEEDDDELEQDERLPQEVTPALYMEVFNCEICRCRHDVRVERLADWLKENENVCVYAMFHDEYANSDPDVEPMDFLSDKEMLYFIDNPDDPLELLDLGLRSHDTFSMEDEYYWYDDKNNKLCSSNTPFADGVIDATALARYAVESHGACLEEILSQMSDRDMVLVFGTSDPKEV